MHHVLTCFLVVASVLGLPSNGFAQDAPKFAMYSAKLYEGKRAPLSLSTPEARKYRTRLTEAYRNPINFGGRYVFTSWGAGTRCETGAILDVVTGRPYMLPFAVCFAGEGQSAFTFRSNSKLLIVSGQMSEAGGNGVHFLEFTSDGLKFVKTILEESAETSQPRVSLPDGATSLSLCGPNLHAVEVEEAVDGRRIPVKPSHISEEGRKEWSSLENKGNLVVWCKFDRHSVNTRSDKLPADVSACIFEKGKMQCFSTRKTNLLAKLFGGDDVADIEPAAGDPNPLLASFGSHPRLGALWKCYDDGIKLYMSHIVRAAPDEKRFTLGVLSQGGFFTLGDKVRLACNKEYIGDLDRVTMDDEQKQMNVVFMAYLADQDSKLIDQCRSHAQEDDWRNLVEFCGRMKQVFQDQRR